MYGDGDRGARHEFALRRERHDRDLRYLRDFCAATPSLVDLTGCLQVEGAPALASLAAGERPAGIQDSDSAASACQPSMPLEQAGEGPPNGQHGDAAREESTAQESQGARLPPASEKEALEQLAERCQSVLGLSEQQVSTSDHSAIFDNH
jgi:hypothetical protein